MNISELELRKFVREEIQTLQEREDYTIELARAYHVAMDQSDYDELGKKVDRKKFKKYFRIPKDADEDPNYKRDPRFNIKKLSRIKEEVKTLKEANEWKKNHDAKMAMGHVLDIKKYKIRYLVDAIKDENYTDPRGLWEYSKAIEQMGKSLQKLAVQAQKAKQKQSGRR